MQPIIPAAALLLLKKETPSILIIESQGEIFESQIQTVLIKSLFTIEKNVKITIGQNNN